MPIMEFQCEKCGTVVEKIVNHSDKVVIEFKKESACKACGGTAFKKIMSIPGFAWNNPETG